MAQPNQSYVYMPSRNSHSTPCALKMTICDWLPFEYARLFVQSLWITHWPILQSRPHSSLLYTSRTARVWRQASDVMSTNLRRSARIADESKSTTISSMASNSEKQTSTSSQTQIVPVIKKQKPEPKSSTGPKSANSQPPTIQTTKAVTSKRSMGNTLQNVDALKQRQEDAFQNLPPEVLDMIINNVGAFASFATSHILINIVSYRFLIPSH